MYRSQDNVESPCQMLQWSVHGIKLLPQTVKFSHLVYFLPCMGDFDRRFTRTKSFSIKFATIKYVARRRHNFGTTSWKTWQSRRKREKGVRTTSPISDRPGLKMAPETFKAKKAITVRVQSYNNISPACYIASTKMCSYLPSKPTYWVDYSGMFVCPKTILSHIVLLRVNVW